MPDSLHVDIPDDQIHKPKGFASASKNTETVKDEQGGLRWDTRYTLPPAKNFVLASSTPPTESNGDIYMLVDSSVPHADWDGASENDWVRYDTSADTWFSITPVEGVMCYDKTANALKIFGTSWTIGGENEPQLLETSLVITSEQIVLLNGTPLQIVASPGANKIIEVISWSVQALATVSTPYTTNTTLLLINDGADRYQAEDRLLLKTSIAKITRGTITAASSTASENQVLIDTRLMVSALSGNPAAGNFDIKIFLQYRIIKL